MELVPAGVVVAVFDVPSNGGGRVGKFCESVLEIDSKFEESTENWACWFGLFHFGVEEGELVMLLSFFSIWAGLLTRG